MTAASTTPGLDATRNEEGTRSPPHAGVPWPEKTDVMPPRCWTQALIVAASLVDVDALRLPRGGLHVIRAVASINSDPELNDLQLQARQPSGLAKGVVVPTRQGAASAPTDAPQQTNMWQRLRGGYQSQREKAAELFKRYGGAYILCSLTLSACSFALFYALVSGGVDVASLLSKVGISIKSATSEKLGTVGLAYLLHKAASPIRFPPTLALTALVGQRLERWSKGDAPKADGQRRATA